MRILVIMLLLSPVALFARVLDWKGVDRRVSALMEEWEVPGVAVAVVDGSHVMTKGYGVRRLGSEEKVTSQTLFSLGSITKTFTASALALLESDGLVSYTDPVIRHYSDLQLYDAYATQELTLEDLIAHRSGLPANGGDFLWYHRNVRQEDLLGRLRHLGPSTGFRETFGMQNLLYLAAAKVIDRASGVPWQDYLDKRFFKPLVMTSTTTSPHAFDEFEDVAFPHADQEGEIAEIGRVDLSAVAPAGALVSNASDLGKWIRFHLKHKKQLEAVRIEEAAVEGLHQPAVVVGKSDEWRLRFPAAKFLSYGRGFFTYLYRGETVVAHTGNVDGMSSILLMIPEKNLGIAVLTNLDASLLPNILACDLVDLSLGKKGVDWNAYIDQEMAAIVSEEEVRRDNARQARQSNTNPQVTLDQFVGMYEDSFYGRLRIAKIGDELTLYYSDVMKAHLKHWHFNTFEVRFDSAVNHMWLGPQFATFTLGDDGRVADFAIPGIHSGRFHKVKY